MAPNLPPHYQERLEKIGFIGVVCVVLRLRHSVTENYWLNINDPRIPYNGFIEYTNLNPTMTGDGSSIVYVPFYMPTSHRRFSFSDEQHIRDAVASLAVVNRRASADWVIDAAVSRDPYAQVICDTGFRLRAPEHRTPVDGLYLIESSQLYPSDRTISGTLESGDERRRPGHERMMATCPVCGGPGRSGGGPAHAARRPFASPEFGSTRRHAEPPEIATCGRCGLGWRIAPPSPAELTRAYRAMRDDTYVAESANRIATFERGASLVARHLGPRRVDLLDVGCSAGLFLDVALRGAGTPPGSSRRSGCRSAPAPASGIASSPRRSRRRRSAVAGSTPSRCGTCSSTCQTPGASSSPRDAPSA